MNLVYSVNANDLCTYQIDLSLYHSHTQVFKVAVIGCSLVTGLMIACGVGIGAVVGAGPHESSFVSACFSLSSTPLIVRFLSPGSGKKEEGM